MKGTYLYAPAVAPASVSALLLYTTRDRTGQAVADITTFTQPAAGTWQFQYDVPEGRYWPAVDTADADAVPYVDQDLPALDVTSRPDLLAMPEDVAIRLGLTLPLTLAQRDRILDELDAVQADVETALSRPLTWQEQTVTEAYPRWGVDMARSAAWPILNQFSDTVHVLTYAQDADPSKGWNLTVRVGFPEAGVRAVRRYLAYHAAEALRNDPSSGMGKRRVNQLSADGQSLTYETGGAGSTQAGADTGVPAIADLQRRYKRRTILMPPQNDRGPWPYTGRAWR